MKRANVKNISWYNYNRKASDLCAEMKSSNYKPDIVISVQRGGYYLSRYLANKFNIPIIDLRVNRTKGDKVYSSKVLPKIIQDIKNFKSLIKNSNVLLIDDIAGTGETLKFILYYLKEFKPKAIKATVLFAKPMPISNKLVDFYCEELRPEDWIIFPWERIRQKRYSCSKIIKNLLGCDDTLIKEYETNSFPEVNKNITFNSDLSVHYENTLLVRDQKITHQQIVDLISNELKKMNYDISISSKVIEDTYYHNPKHTEEKSFRIRKFYKNTKKNIFNLWCLSTEENNTKMYTIKKMPNNFSKESVRLISFDSKDKLTMRDLLNIQNIIESELNASNIQPYAYIQKYRTQIDIKVPDIFNSHRNANKLMRIAIDHIDSINLIQEKINISPNNVGGKHIIEIEINKKASQKGKNFAKNALKIVQKNFETINRPGRKIEWIRFIENRTKQKTTPLDITKLNFKQKKNTEIIRSIYQNNIKKIYL